LAENKDTNCIPLPPTMGRIGVMFSIVRSFVWVSGLFIGCVLNWCHLVNACEIKAHVIGCWQNLCSVSGSLYGLG